MPTMRIILVVLLTNMISTIALAEPLARWLAGVAKRPVFLGHQSGHHRALGAVVFRPRDPLEFGQSGHCAAMPRDFKAALTTDHMASPFAPRRF